MRLIVRKERPHPGAQLRFTDVDGHRFTAFATDAKKGQLADLEARLYLDSALNAVKDRLLVIELGEGAAGRGGFADTDGLRAILPGVTLA